MPNGIMVWSFWQFGDDERLKKKVVDPKKESKSKKRRKSVQKDNKKYLILNMPPKDRGQLRATEKYDGNAKRPFCNQLTGADSTTSQAFYTAV